jgi:hypothetical protein
VNIFVQDRMLRDHVHLRDEVGANTTVFIMQALSGGSRCAGPKTEAGPGPR